MTTTPNVAVPLENRLSDGTTTFQFELVISAWTEKLPCEITTQAGAKCRRPAKYRVTCHECGRGVVCGQHLQAFLRQLHDGDLAQCNQCGRVFPTINDAITVAEL